MDLADSIPPAIRIILDEDLTPDDIGACHESLVKLVPELERQAEWTLKEFKYTDQAKAVQESNQGRLVVTASGGLNPLSSQHGICVHPECRKAAATSFARTLGLYADVVTIPDALSPLLARKRSSNSGLYLVGIVSALKALAPMIKTGVVRFRAGSRAFCAKHYEEFEIRASAVASQVLPTATEHVHFSRAGDLLTITEDDPKVSTTLQLTEDEIKQLDGEECSLNDIGSKHFLQLLQGDVRETLMDLQSSAQMRAPLLSSSRNGLIAARSLEASRSHRVEVSTWETAQSVELPWVNQLGVEQVLQLRDEASVAMPRFREEFLRTLFRSGDDESGARKAIDELRASAAEVDSELRALDAKREGVFRTVTGVIGLTASVYGFASGAVPPGVAIGGLMSLLGLLHSSGRSDAREGQMLQSRPAYVLLRARELALHAEHRD